MRYLLLILSLILLPASAFAVNSWSGLTSLHALYNFESGSTVTDSEGSSDFTIYGNAASNTNQAPNQAADSYSVDFDGADDCLYVTDAALATGHPLKAGVDGSFTIFGWFTLDIITGQVVFTAKFDEDTGDRTIIVGKVDSADGTYPNRPFIMIGVGTDSSTELFVYDTVITTGRWYHIVYTHDKSGASEVGNLRVWDETANDWLGGDANGWVSHTYTADINTTGDDYLAIGANVRGTTPNFDMDGRADEVGYCTAVVSQTDLTAIKSGTYGAAASTQLKVMGVATWAKINGVASPAKINGVTNE